VNHKKRDILFLTISLANLNRFLWFTVYTPCPKNCTMSHGGHFVKS